ncbi:hypothetical protein EMCG_08990 [[Emmonsia] crescens]|uniref:Uncharacterized protein n=1 Tax=[Emmonsia] crescens TaxID=73230 RepID=A0A0G2I4J8_9EURO|nr:hypothetical protein EMCG_08990 [Emmonsia crescens UAMH 3008]
MESPFRSRRSHTSLHHISLAPLTSRFPLDDDDGPDSDYFYSNDDDLEPSRRFAYSPHPATTSYLASASVPTTPPILSRNTSYTNLSKRKTTPSLSQMSDTNLNKMNSEQTRHHRRVKSYTQGPKLNNTVKRQDSEWLLRAGLALSSSTREEKGQSWLVKRDSSTSLVSEEIPDNERRHSSHHSRHSRLTGRASISDDAVGLVPDFVDENLRSEMGAISSWPIGQANTPSQRSVRGFDDGTYPTVSRRNSTFDSAFSASASELSDSEIDEEEEVDEAEMQRLTRERGLGLGRWIDRLVAWTLFSVEEEIPGVIAEPSRQPRQFGDIQHQTWVEESGNNSNEDQGSLETESENQQGKEEDENSMTLPIENPGDRGGWSDAGWLLRVAKSIVI